LVLWSHWQRLPGVRVLSVPLCGPVDSGRFTAFVEEVLDAVLDGRCLGGNAGFALALLGDALAVFSGRGFDAAFFFVEAALFKFATDFWGQVLGFVDSAAVVVAETTGCFGAGDGCECDFASVGVYELVCRSQWWLITFVFRCLVVFEATECVAESAFNNVLGVAS
jgi:hypothetical protein